MEKKRSKRISPAIAVSFGIALALAALAIYNFATGAYGGAVVSSVGAVIATLFGTLTQP